MPEQDEVARQMFGQDYDSLPISQQIQVDRRVDASEAADKGRFADKTLYLPDGPQGPGTYAVEVDRDTDKVTAVYGRTSPPAAGSSGPNYRPTPGLVSTQELQQAGAKPAGIANMEITLPDGRVQRFYRDEYDPNYWHSTAPTKAASTTSGRTITLPKTAGTTRYDTDILGANRPGAVATLQVAPEEFINFQLGQVGQGSTGDINTDAQIAGDLALSRAENNAAIIKAFGERPSTSPDPLTRATQDAITAFKLQQRSQELQDLGLSAADAADRLRGGPPGLSEAEATKYAYRPSPNTTAFVERTAYDPERTSEFLGKDASKEYYGRVNELNSAINDERQAQYQEPVTMAEGGEVDVNNRPDGLDKLTQEDVNYVLSLPEQDRWVWVSKKIRGDDRYSPTYRDQARAIVSYIQAFPYAISNNPPEVQFAIDQAVAARERAGELRAREVAGLPNETAVNLPLGSAKNPPKLGSGFYASYPDAANSISNLELTRASMDPQDPDRARIAREIAAIRGMLPSSGVAPNPAPSRNEDDESNWYRGPTQFAMGGKLIAPEEIIGLGRFTGKPYFRLAENMPYAGKPELVEVNGPHMKVTPMNKIRLGRAYA